MAIFYLHSAKMHPFPKLGSGDNLHLAVLSVRQWPNGNITQQNKKSTGQIAPLSLRNRNVLTLFPPSYMSNPPSTIDCNPPSYL